MSFQPIFYKTGNNHDTNDESDKSGLGEFDETRTQQQFAEEVDINTIIRRFGLDGKLPENVRMPQSGDFTNLPDFKSAMNAIRAAQESFDAMPARIRSRFDNDPAKFVAFCDDPENRAEAIRYGLIEKPLTPEPKPTITTPPAAPAAPAPTTAPVTK